ncbi:MAG: TonB-dependent receptor [Bacteroidales bacterium]
MKKYNEYINSWIQVILYLVISYHSDAQNPGATINGIVTDTSGLPISYATVALKGTEKGTLTNESGLFSLNRGTEEVCIICVQSMGFEKATVKVTGKQTGTNGIVIVLKSSNIKLDEIIVSAKSESFKIREKAFNVAAMDVNKLQNSNLNVNNVLGRVPGVNIREEGGLGSDFKFSVNGLSGKQVKFFMDGVPMDQYGSSFSINNIPVNMIERVEVYKGVVPVWLGSDALGGAVNIVTRKNTDNFLDASYSLGSFNTHKASVNGKYTIGERGLSVQSAAYYNYSDNNYQVDDIETHDELGNVIGTTSATRFHDSYRSVMFQTKLGFENMLFADKFFIGLTLAGNRNNIQHGLSLERVFGQVHTRDNLFKPMFEFRKTDLFIKGLTLNSYASYIGGLYEVIDTSSREYSWDGSYSIRNNQNIGESDWHKSLFSFNDETFLTVNNASYKVKSHEIALNHTHTMFIRQGDDPYDPDIVPFSDPNFLQKTVFGLSYSKSFFDEKLSATIFSKYFVYNGKIIEEELFSGNPSAITHYSRFRNPGFGLAGTWKVTNGIQLKTSYENTYRLPEGREIFGDGLNVISNPGLQPEHSSNYNAGVLFLNRNGKNTIVIESNYFFRDAENLIRLAATGAKSEFVNLANANIQGIESEITIRRNETLQLTVNGTFQNLINKTKVDENGKSNHTYLDRLPNIPYFFGNLILGILIHDLINSHDKFQINWYSRYVHEFYLQWPAHGESKSTIPTQFIHTVELNYSLRNETYNFVLGASNLLDSKAYDNFRIQKPGRAVYIKFRYFI